MKNILTIKDRQYDLTRQTLVMGILNVTPDSFSDGGQFFNWDKAVNCAVRMAAEGAHIIDIGGESTRPGYTPVSAKEEAARIIPVIREVCAAVEAPVSVDTSKAVVAEQALAAGAAMINDVWGGKKDADILKLAADARVPICLMHNRSEAVYTDLMQEIRSDLLESVALALKAGILEENIILDPGIGFGKTLEHNLLVMKHLDVITSLGYPVLLGTSRKSMIGKVLDLPVDQRLEGTAATVAYGITRGVKIVRVHDVLAMSRVARMTDAMLRGGL